MEPVEILEKFKVLFADSFASFPENYKGSRRFVLTEPDKNAVLRAIEIRGVPENSILLKMQNYKPPEDVFKSTRGERKMCDYILLTFYRDDLYFIFIELKSRSLDNNDIIPQLKGGYCFMTYCGAIVKEFHGTQISPQRRNIVFHSRLPCSKNPTHLSNKFKKTISNASSISAPVIRISCAIKEGRAFTRFDRLMSDMA